ncbi:MAG: glycosyltransferase family 4 protein [Lautropia sp.]
MNILFLTDNFVPERNAPATRTYEHAVQWVRDGHSVTVVTTAPNFPEGKVFAGYANAWWHVEDIDGIRVVRVKTYISANEGFLRRSFDYASFFIAGSIAALCLPRPDVLVATSPQFFCAMAGWFVSRLRRLPWVFEVRDLWPASIVAVGAMKPGFAIRVLEWLELRMYRSARLVVSVTRAFKADLVARGVPADKIQVVLNGVDQTRFSPRPPDPELLEALDLRGRFVVGYLGTMGMAHALDKVLDAAALLKHRTDIAFLIAGSGARRGELEARVAAEALSNVRFLAPQAKERMPQLWSLHDLALIPLQRHPLFKTVIPSKMFEAMGMGVPVLMSLPEGEATSMVRETDAGVCVPPEDPRALADAVLALVADPARMTALRTAALAAAPRFCRQENARAMVEYLARVANPGSDTAQQATPSLPPNAGR